MPLNCSACSLLSFLCFGSLSVCLCVCVCVGGVQLVVRSIGSRLVPWLAYQRHRRCWNNC